MYSYFDFDNNHTCNICHMVKQKKLSYLISNFVTSHSFELLHFDIWGPFDISYIQKHIYILPILDDHKDLYASFS